MLPSADTLEKKFIKLYWLCCFVRYIGARPVQHYRDTIRFILTDMIFYHYTDTNLCIASVLIRTRTGAKLLFQSRQEHLQNRCFNQDTNRCRTCVLTKTRTGAHQVFQVFGEQVQNSCFNQDKNICQTDVSIRTRTSAEQAF